MNLTRILLIVVLVSISISALMGIATILTAGEPNWRIIATMMSVAFFSLSAMGCGFVLERRNWRVAMRVGIGIAVVGLLVYLLEIWLDVLGYWNNEEILGSIAIWTVAFPIAGLLALTRFNNALRYVRLATLGLILLASAMLTLTLLAENMLFDRDIWPRFLAILVILSILGTIATPVLHKMAGEQVRPPVETTPLVLNIQCPRCLLRQDLKPGESRCAQCRLKFVIDIEEPRCPSCKYLLFNLTTPRCPECGQSLGAEEIPPTAMTPGGASS